MIKLKKKLLKNKIKKIHGCEYSDLSKSVLLLIIITGWGIFAK
jgi:hypothetical protein